MTEREREARRLRLFLARMARDQDTAAAYAGEYDWDEMQPALTAAERVMKALPAALAAVEHTVQAAIRQCEAD